MSVYKIIIGNDMAPQNKNTSHVHKLVHIYHLKCHVKKVEAKKIGLQKKGTIWELFFALQTGCTKY